MWEHCVDEEESLKNILPLMKHSGRFGDQMLLVIMRWKYSCEHNLTNHGQNRVAWLGQAACAMAQGTPEYITRKAWGFLTQDEQKAANRRAERAIEIWEKRQKKRPNERALIGQS